MNSFGGSQRDGKHGAIQDSASMSWRAIYEATKGNTLYKQGMVRVAATDGETEGRDWTIYEMVDTQQQTADDIEDPRLLIFRSIVCSIGRGRVVAQPFVPDWAPDGVSSPALDIARGRARSVRATSIDFAAEVESRGTDLVPSALTLVDNYRVWISEGRPVRQPISSLCYIASQADYVGLVNPDDYDPITRAMLANLTKVPDFASYVTVPRNGLGNVVIAFIDVNCQTRQAFPTAMILGDGPCATVPIPSWATYMLLTSAAVPSTTRLVVPCVWECMF